ncbi:MULTISPECIES: hypothetical protein [Yersinia pseudotuberculosis complex]|uniref:hypothetical protein n=1 Tax=Yersinia pseudotuberculosis complex TaxID=1649845 RepID=UPI00059ADAB9|nr:MULTISPECIES: hypothetical protein [Yersinia pseudotuberculosis complex]MCE4113280.1 hypothetical protein [Yersinia pseudotuberculosis]RYC26155.1 hypothetical protein EU971_10720 [Yersinia pseudotuberculosis]UFA64124.1 Uncharacterized protein YP598_4516 [Yersinia pseudotuberculosis]WLF06109.1 hypothetical protein Q6G25_21045 [Yersinia pseudotuberculosis]
MPLNRSPNSSWGNPTNEVNVRTLYKYKNILALLEMIGENIFYALLIAFIFMFIWMYTETNFENIIFDDGTSHLCILDGKTGVITNVIR